jgi:hypothetical protein
MVTGTFARSESEIEEVRQENLRRDAEAIAEAKHRGIHLPKMREVYYWQLNGTTPLEFVKIRVRRLDREKHYQRLIVHYVIRSGKTSTIEGANFLGWRGKTILKGQDFRRLRRQGLAVLAE